MFDQMLYSKINQAYMAVLNNNLATVGRPFANAFANDHDPNVHLQNATSLQNYVINTFRNAYPGQTSIPDNELFAIVERYVSTSFQNVQSRAQQAQGFGMQQRPTSFAQAAFGSPMGQPMSMASSIGNGVIGASQQPQGQAAPAKAAPAPAPTAVSISPALDRMNMMTVVATPFDDADDANPDYNPVPKQPVWGLEGARDNRIVISRREELQLGSGQRSVTHITAYHQAIQDDPRNVVRDFFKIVPTDYLGTWFITRIGYDHLDIIDIPTDTLIDLREQCIHAVQEDRNTLLYKTIGRILDKAPRGYWKAITDYLIGHVNRALLVSGRLTNNLKPSIKLGSFEDIGELLDPASNNIFTQVQDGRRQLSDIVNGSIWNALVLNANVLFRRGGKPFIPTHAIQASDAFPYSIEGVYPNKYAIPVNDEERAEQFLETLQDKVLSQKSFVITRRAVTITNIMGRKILPALSTTPQVFTSVVAPVLNMCSIPFAQLAADVRDSGNMIQPMANEEHPATQLDDYYANPQDYREKIVAEQPKKPLLYPVDQTLFAVQQGVSPDTYLRPIDVLSTMDRDMKGNQVALVNRALSVFDAK